MAEIVGVVAAAIELAKVSFAIFETISKIREAPQAVAARAGQARQLADLAQLIQRTPRLNASPVLDAALRDCLRDVEAMRVVVEGCTLADDAGRAGRAWKALGSAARERRLTELGTRLEQRKSMLVLCISSIDAELLGTMSTDLTAVREGVGRMLQDDVPAIRRAVERLSLAESSTSGVVPRPEAASEELVASCRASLGFPAPNHGPRLPSYLDKDACSWFFETSEWSSWLNDPSCSTLLVNANPGCGKTILASRLVTHLESLQHDQLPLSTEAHNVVVSFFFSATNAEASDNASACLKSLIVQLATIAPTLFPLLLESYKTLVAKGDTSWSWNDLSKSFTICVSALRQTSCIYIVLDALDECDSASRTQLFEFYPCFLEDRAATKAAAIKTLITSRPNEDIYFDLSPTFHNW